MSSLLSTMLVNKAKFYDPNTAVYHNPKTDRQVAIITGGNQGIGWFSVLNLYLHGYTVYLLARNQEKALKAIEDIKVEAKKRIDEYTPQQKPERFVGELHHIKCDLGDLSSVKQAAETFSKAETKLDLLINNAAVMGVPYETTKDDLEIQYQVNVTSHVLLTLSLLPLLHKSKAPRVVHLSSIAHFTARSSKPGEKLDKFPNALYSVVRYAKAKLGAIHFMKALAKKNPDILCIAVHPGVIDSALYDDLASGYSIFAPVVKFMIFKAFAAPLTISTELGCTSSLRAALDPTLTTEKDNGKYFTNGGIEMEPSKLAKNPKEIEHTYDWNVEELAKRGYAF